MIRSLYTAATGMKAQQLQIDVTSNNISNVNTIGYKKQRAEFADLFIKQWSMQELQLALLPCRQQELKLVLVLGQRRLQRFFSRKLQRD